MKLHKKTLHTMSIVMSTLLFTVFPAGATGLAGSQLGLGIQNLINDASSLLLILCPIAGGAAAVYFFIRRSMSDEQDGKMWEKRIKTAIFCGVGGGLAGAVISLIASYF